MPRGLVLAAQGVTSGELWDISLKGLLSLDGAAHHRRRRLVSKSFTPRAAERLRTTCTDVIAELVDNQAGSGRCDVVADIARQYPIPIICAMLGTPSDDWHLFSDWADDVFKLFDWNVVNDEPDILRAWHALEDYLDDMVIHRRDALTDDLLSDMIRAEIDGDRLAHDELLMLAATLLMAGTDTTRNQLAAAVQVFSEHPDQWALLAEHPAACPEGSRRGALIIANTAAANRDPAVYEDADRRHVDLRRWHPLLPGCAPRENRTRRSPDDDGAPHAQHPSRRHPPMEVDNGHHRSSELPVEFTSHP
jgi:cytochrome P450